MNIATAMPTDVTAKEKMIILVLSTKSNLKRVIMAPPIKPPNTPAMPGSAAQQTRTAILTQTKCTMVTHMENYSQHTAQNISQKLVLPAPIFALNAGMW